MTMTATNDVTTFKDLVFEDTITDLCGVTMNDSVEGRLVAHIMEKKPNDKVKLTLFRFDKMREVNFTLGSDLRRDYGFSAVDNPTADQRRLYKSYLNEDLQ